MGKTTSLALFKGGSRYGVGGHFIDALAAGFRTLGADATILDPTCDTFTPRMAALLGARPNACIALNANSFEFQVGGTSLHELLGCPLIGLYIDDPLTPALSARLSRKDHLATFPSPDLARWVGERFGIRTATLYHGATPPSDTSQDRTIDLLFCGTYVPPEVEVPGEWIYAKPPSGHWLQGEAHLPRVETALRALRRERLLQTLGESGRRVTLVGEGWELCPSASGHTLLGPLPFDEANQLLAKAKVCLHITPPFCSGSHERPLNAMLRGTAVVTDRTPFFEGEEGLLTYSWNDLATLPQIVGEALNRWEELGKEGQKAVQSSHLWQHRAAEILEFIDVDRNV